MTEELSEAELSFDPSWYPLFRLQRRKPKIIMSNKWALGFHDRGHGHGDFGVILEEPCQEWLDFLKDVENIGNGNLKEWLAKPFVIKCSERDVAKHIVDLHNASLGG